MGDKSQSRFCWTSKFKLFILPFDVIIRKLKGSYDAGLELIIILLIHKLSTFFTISRFRQLRLDDDLWFTNAMAIFTSEVLKLSAEGSDGVTDHSLMWKRLKGMDKRGGYLVHWTDWWTIWRWWVGKPEIPLNK